MPYLKSRFILRWPAGNPRVGVPSGVRIVLFFRTYEFNPANGFFRLSEQRVQAPKAKESQIQFADVRQVSANR